MRYLITSEAGCDYRHTTVVEADTPEGAVASLFDDERPPFMTADGQAYTVYEVGADVALTARVEDRRTRDGLSWTACQELIIEPTKVPA